MLYLKTLVSETDNTWSQAKVFKMSVTHLQHLLSLYYKNNFIVKHVDITKIVILKLFIEQNFSALC